MSAKKEGPRNYKATILSKKDNTNELYNLGFDPKSEVIKLFEIYENMLKNKTL